VDPQRDRRAELKVLHEHQIEPAVELGANLAEVGGLLEPEAAMKFERASRTANLRLRH
jgi:hypothetical protein